MIYKIPEHYRIHFAKHGLDYDHVLDDREVDSCIASFKRSPSHAHESDVELLHRAAYFLIWKKHQATQNDEKMKKAASFDGRLASIEKRHKKHTLGFFIVVGLLVLLLLFVAARAHAQESVVVRGNNPGASTASPVSVVPNCAANTNCLAVQPVGAGSGGTSSNFGAAFPVAGTAAGFKNGGGNMDFALVDGSNFLKVDCAVGCAGGSADSTASGALSVACADGSINSCAANSTVALAMAGVNSASISLPSGNNFVGTIKADCSTDGGTTWFLTNIRTSALSQWVASIAVSSTNQGYEVEVCGGASHVRVRASVATSGTVTAAVRGVSQPSGLPGFAGVPGSAAPTFGTFMVGTDGSLLRGIKTDASGDVNVVFPSAQAVTQSGGPWTVNKTQTAGSTLGALANYGTSPGAVLVESVNAFVTNTPTVTANAGTNLNTSALALESGGNLATIGGAIIAQEATTSGVKGITAFGAVTTSAPTYTTAKSDALSLTTGGALRQDITTIAGTAPTTVGKLDVKGADGDVFVRQATASNLNATVVGTKTNNNAAPGATNIGALPALANASTQTWTEGDLVVESVDLSGRQRVRGILSDNGAAAGSDAEADVPGIYQTSYLNGTAATQGRNGALSLGTDGLLWTAALPSIRPASFSTSKKFAGSSTTDVAVMPGNASNTVLLTEIRVSCTQTTAGILNLEVIKRSAADTAGTSAAMTAVPDDSNYSAAVSAPLSYTGTGPAVGAAVGDIDNYQLGCLAAGTAGANDIYIGNFKQKPIVLRGTAQQVALNFGGAITGGNITVTFKWIETATITP